MLYFFNLAGAVYDPDVDGHELETIADARIQAVRCLAEFIKDEPQLVWGGEEVRVEVTDSNQLILCTVIVFGIDAPAAGGASPAC